MKIKLLCALDVLLCACLAWFLLWNAFEIVAFDADLYYELQTKAGVLETAGIDSENLRNLDIALAIKLGRTNIDGADLTIEVGGQYVPAFNEREMQHLEDCRRLIQGFDLSANIALGAFAALLLLRLWMKCGWRDSAFLRRMRIGFLLPLVPVALLGIWALADFNSAFNFFHKILFTNDLWLLDPRTDLLIRICPGSMFAAMGARIAVYAAIALLGVPVLYTLACRALAQRQNRGK